MRSKKSRDWPKRHLLTMQKKLHSLTERFGKRLTYGWKEVELHLGMFIAQQVVWTSLLKRNTLNDLTRRWNVGQKKLS